MVSQKSRNLFFISTLVLSLLVLVVSCYGLFNPSSYESETPNWQAQSRGQDAVDLILLVPVLMISSVLMLQGRRSGILILSGALFYLTYTFAIYSFALHFNPLFPLYCTTLGVAFYLLVYLLLKNNNGPQPGWLVGAGLRKTSAYYLMIVSTLFYLLWMSDIMPHAVQHTVPPLNQVVGLPVNPVHVLDLSVCLPALFIAGFLFLKQHPLGNLLAPAMLVFCTLMDITLASLMGIMYLHHFEVNWVVAGGLLVLACFSLALVVLNLRRLKNRLPL